jgi:glycosyltransferase involved in cell wall biosynthesis
MTDAHAAHVVMLVRNPYTHDTRVEKEARTLMDAGYRVTVVADAADGRPAGQRRPSGEAVVRIARRGPRVPGLRYVLHELRLARRLAALAPDVLHAHDSNALPAVALAAGRRVPFVYDAHDLWLGRPRRDRGRLSFALNQLWYTLVERLLVPRAAAAMTVSPPIARHLEKRYGLAEVALVPNYPDPDADAVPGVLDLRLLPGAERLAPDRPVVLYLGGLMAGRGLEQLVDAMAHTERPQLVLLGEGQLAEALRARAVRRGIADRVHHLAPVPPDDVIAVAATADVGVSPIVPSCLNYRWSLPNKLFQYLAAGIPVVASDFPQVREIIEDARAGLVADTTSSAAVAAAIDAVLADPDEAKAMGERGRAAVADRFNWDVSARSLLEVDASVSMPGG